MKTMQLLPSSSPNWNCSYCRQLKVDVDSYNDNNSHSGCYQLILNFAEDVAEREQPTKYTPLPKKPK